MIPKNIEKKDVLAALLQIDQRGVPKSKLSRIYFVRYNGKYYPPKYVISLANIMANGSDAPSVEYSGGAETNNFLVRLGFEIVPSQERIMLDPQIPKIVTVTLESNLAEHPKFSNRLKMLRAVIEIYRNSNVILFPAGFLYFRKQKSERIREAAKAVCELLEYYSSSAVVCFGIDCDDGKDQLAVAVNNNDILAIGRKFYPTADEEGVIRKADKYDSEEMGYTRFFEINGKRFYIAVCYDGFGIRHCGIQNPGVDAVLILAHQFRNRGEGPSGDVDFARKGFAGASQHWGCPVFGTAVFFNRKIPENWPTGVMWAGSAKSVKNFKYQDNTLHWNIKNVVQSGYESALCSEYFINNVKAK